MKQKFPKHPLEWLQLRKDGEEEPNLSWPEEPDFGAIANQPEEVDRRAKEYRKQMYETALRRHRHMESLRALGIDDIVKDMGGEDANRDFITQINMPSPTDANLALKDENVTPAQLRYAIAVRRPGYQGAIYHAVAQHPKLDEATLRFMLQHPHSAVAYAALNRAPSEKLTPELLDVALHHPDQSIRGQAAMHMNLTSEQIRRFLSDKNHDRNTRENLLLHDNAPEDMLVDIAREAIRRVKSNDDPYGEAAYGPPNPAVPNPAEFNSHRVLKWLTEHHAVAPKILDELVDSNQSELWKYAFGSYSARQGYIKPGHIDKMLKSPDMDYEDKYTHLARLREGKGDILTEAQAQHLTNLPYDGNDDYYAIKLRELGAQDLTQRFPSVENTKLLMNHPSPSIRRRALRQDQQHLSKLTPEEWVDYLKRENNYDNLRFLVAGYNPAMPSELRNHPLIQDAVLGHQISQLRSDYIYGNANLDLAIKRLSHPDEDQRSDFLVPHVLGRITANSNENQQKLYDHMLASPYGDVVENGIAHMLSDNHDYLLKRPDVFHRLTAHPSEQVRAQLAHYTARSHMFLTENADGDMAPSGTGPRPDFVDAILRDKSPEVRRALVKFMPKDHFTPQMVDALINDSSEDVRSKLAEKAGERFTPEQALKGLEDKEMRFHLLSHPAVPREWLTKFILSKDDPNITNAERYHALRKGKNVDPAIFRQLVDDPNEDIRITAFERGDFSMEELRQHLKKQHAGTETHQHLRRILAQGDPDSQFKERVGVLFDTGKLRKLRDYIGVQNPQTRNMHPKEVAKFLGGDYGKFRDKHGLINADMIQDYLDKTPRHIHYNISHSYYGESGWDHSMNSNREDGHYGPLAQQRHNRSRSKVFQINVTNDIVKKLRQANLYDTFHGIMDDHFYGAHPVRKPYDHDGAYVTLGWVRYTGSPKGGIFVDELQSDFGQGIHKYLKRGDITEDTAKSLMQICFGGKHPSVALHEAFHQYLRDRGHAGTKVAVHALPTKAAISLQSFPAEPAPRHMQIGYEEHPQKMGLEPGTYSKQNMPTQDNPKLQGKPTWQGVLRKYEEGQEPLTAEELEVLEAILGS